MGKEQLPTGVASTSTRKIYMYVLCCDDLWLCMNDQILELSTSL